MSESVSEKEVKVAQTVRQLLQSLDDLAKMELLDEDEVFDQREAVLTGLATRSKPLKEGAKVLDQLLEWEVLTETDYKVFRNKCKAAIAKTKVGKDGKKVRCGAPVRTAARLHRCGRCGRVGVAVACARARLQNRRRKRAHRNFFFVV